MIFTITRFSFHVYAVKFSSFSPDIQFMRKRKVDFSIEVYTRPLLEVIFEKQRLYFVVYSFICLVNKYFLNAR